MQTQPSTNHPAKPNAAETITVESHEFACDGASGINKAALGHPRVFLVIGADGTVDCGYCGNHYVLRNDSANHG